MNFIKNMQLFCVIWRFYGICFLILFVFIMLIFKLFYLHMIISKELIKKGDVYSLQMRKYTFCRNRIYDRNGSLLSISIPVYAVYADSKEIYSHGGIVYNDKWKLLSDALKISFDKLVDCISSNKDSHFIYLIRQIDVEVGNFIRDLKLRGIYLKKELKRYYPLGKFASHVVGITDIDHNGIEGVEKSFDNILRGKSYKCLVRKDRMNRVIERLNCFNNDHQVSSELYLSINKEMQLFMFNELNRVVVNNDAESGSAILVDINTGEILGMVNVPTYDPNDFRSSSLNMMRNRAITDVFEPGSVVKPMVIMLALQKGIINKDSILDTSPFFVNGHLIKDVKFHSKLSITEILQKSSNVGVSKLALSIPFSDLFNIYRDFGFFDFTGLGMVGESKGFCSNKFKCLDIDKVVFSYGYGLMVTPLQLAKVYTTIGNMGISKPLSILKISTPCIYGKRVFPESIVHTVLNMLEHVSLPGGSGVKAFIDDYRIAIKTSTVKKVHSNSGKYINRYVACTVGIAPLINPRFVLVIMINDPKKGDYYGGLVSSPLFSVIMKKIFSIANIQPDSSLKCK